MTVCIVVETVAGDALFCRSILGLGGEGGVSHALLSPVEDSGVARVTELYRPVPAPAQALAAT